MSSCFPLLVQQYVHTIFLLLRCAAALAMLIPPSLGSGHIKAFIPLRSLKTWSHSGDESVGIVGEIV